MIRLLYSHTQGLIEGACRFGTRGNANSLMQLRLNCKYFVPIFFLSLKRARNPNDVRSEMILNTEKSGLVTLHQDHWCGSSWGYRRQWFSRQWIYLQRRRREAVCIKDTLSQLQHWRPPAGKRCPFTGKLPHPLNPLRSQDYSFSIINKGISDKAPDNKLLNTRFD